HQIAALDRVPEELERLPVGRGRKTLVAHALSHRHGPGRRDPRSGSLDPLPAGADRAGGRVISFRFPVPYMRRFNVTIDRRPNPGCGGAASGAAAGTIMLVLFTWWSAPPVAAGGDNPPPTLGEITAVMKRQQEQIHSPYVDYATNTQALDKPEIIKKYLRVEFLVQNKKSFAFKGNKRYYHLIQPEWIEAMAPDTEPDYDVIPGGAELKKRMDEMKAQMKQLEETQARLAPMNRPPVGAGGKGKLRQLPETIMAFDGEKMRRKYPGVGADIHGMANINSDAGWVIQDYIDVIGMALPDPFNPAKATKAYRFPDAFAAGGYVVQPAPEDVDGGSCVVVTCPGKETLWLDPQAGYGMRKHEMLAPQTKVLSGRIHNSEFVQIKPGIWLPKVCRRELCAPPLAPAPYGGKPLIRYVYSVFKLTVNDVPDSLFTLEFEPGLRVMEWAAMPPKDGKNQLLTYTMPADPNQLDQTIHDALAKKPGGSEGSVMMKLILVNGILVGLLGLFLIWRWYVKKRVVPASGWHPT